MSEKTGKPAIQYYQKYMKKTVNKFESNEKKQAKRYASNDSLEKSLSSANLLKDGILMIISNQINRILPAEKVILLPI